MKIIHTLDSLKLAEYAQANPGWHNHGMNKRTLEAVKISEILGRIETRRLPGGHNLQRQYRAKLDAQAA